MANPPTAILFNQFNAGGPPQMNIMFCEGCSQNKPYSSFIHLPVCAATHSLRCSEVCC